MTEEVEGELQGVALAASLTVNDVAASLAWYRDVLGFIVDRRFENEGQLRAASMKAGGVRILLGQDNGAKGWDRKKGEGFSLQVTISEPVDDVAGRARTAGAALETEPTDTPWGGRLFRLRDPDGFLLVIASERDRDA